MSECCRQKECDFNHRATFRIALAGNPNCGKSALFNVFTGVRQKTGNWPGVTVDRREGRAFFGSMEVAVIDLPGIYSLDAGSLDERIARDYLLSGDADAIVNVIDASNLERNLYLTLQLLEMNIPVVVALNMMDVARRRGITIDVDSLSRELGCPVMPLVAVKNEGIAELKQAIATTQKTVSESRLTVKYSENIESAISGFQAHMGEVPRNSRRWVALSLLEGDDSVLNPVPPALAAQAESLRERIKKNSGEDPEILIADRRYGRAHELTGMFSGPATQGRISYSDRVDRVVLGRWTGMPLFLLVMYLMFLFTIDVGGAFIEFFDGAANALFVEGTGSFLDSLGAPDWLRVVLADGIGGGLQIVSTFIPIIAALYLFLSVLEDSGYMARAAFVMDRAMRAIGLPGKAFVPLIVGFGCNVPAIMATRTLEHERERKLTILMNPFMSCGARLPVYALFAAAFFPASGQNIVFALYLVGIGIAIATGLIMKRTLLPGVSSSFIMELPTYHRPTLKNVALRTWDRVRAFIKEAGQIIILMVLALNLLNSIGTDGSFGNEDSERSILSAASRTAVPLFSPMGIQQDNWPAVVGIVSGVLAKEVVVGTLNNLYTGLADEGIDEGADYGGVWQGVLEAAATIPVNLAALRNNVLDPLGLDIGSVEDQFNAAREQGVRHGIFGAMVSRFDGRAGAFAYLLFILLYFPCVATIGAIKREAGRSWAGFVALWTTFIAYLTASTFYQIANFTDQPLESGLWLAGLWVAFAVFLMGLRQWGGKRRNPVTYPLRSGT